MEQVTMKREHRYKSEDGREFILPKGWSGAIPADIAADARSKGRLVEDPRTPPPKLVDVTNLEDLKKDQLVALAKERNVVIAGNDRKEDIIAALKKAEAAGQQTGQGGLFGGDGLDQKTPDELLALAKEKGVAVEDGAEKAAIIAALRAASK